MVAPIPCTKQDCPSPLPWLIDFVSKPWLTWGAIPLIRPPRTVTLTDNFPLHPPSFSLLFLLPLKDSSTYKPQLLSLRPPASSAPPPPPLFPSDRLSDSKSETLIQRSAQVSWILLKSHFHFTSSLLASLPPPPVNINLLPLLSLSPSWPHPYTSPIF